MLLEWRSIEDQEDVGVFVGVGCDGLGRLWMRILPRAFAKEDNVLVDWFYPTRKFAIRQS